MRRGDVSGDRTGFTVTELAVVVLVVGILAGLAAPTLRRAMYKADAAAILSDANTVSLAAHAYLGDNGVFPPSGGLGTAPAALEPYLPENFSFVYRPDVRYFWFSIRLPDADNFWRTRSLGFFLVTYPPGGGIAEAMRAHAGPYRYWSGSIFYVVYVA